MTISKIIAGFPGVGKSTYHKEHRESSIDLESSDFSHRVIGGERVKNPEFPENYIREIQLKIGEYDIILISSHQEVRGALTHHKMQFYYVIPVTFLKEEYLENYSKRGNSKEFISLVEKKWDAWIEEAMVFASCVEYPATQVKLRLLGKGVYLTDIIPQILNERIITNKV